MKACQAIKPESRSGTATSATFSGALPGGGVTGTGPPGVGRSSVQAAASARRSKRISEKCPSGGMARRSIMRTPPWRMAQSASVRKGNSGRQPSRRATARTIAPAWRAARFGADVIDQHDFAARPDDAHELVERRFRMRHRGDDILRHHHVEGFVGQRQPLGVHHRQGFHIAEAHARRRAPAPCAASVRTDPRRPGGSTAHSPAAKSRCRRRLRECARRPARPRRSRRCRPRSNTAPKTRS